MCINWLDEQTAAKCKKAAEEGRAEGRAEGAKLSSYNSLLKTLQQNGTLTEKDYEFYDMPVEEFNRLRIEYKGRLAPI